MMAPQEVKTLGGLIHDVIEDEQRFGYATKERLLTVAEYMATKYVGLDYSKQDYTAAIILLAKYHMAPLADRIRGKKLIVQERAKAYEARCCRCGAIISSKKSLATGLGIECRKKVGMKV